MSDTLIYQHIHRLSKGSLGGFLPITYETYIERSQALALSAFSRQEKPITGFTQPGDLPLSMLRYMEFIGLSVSVRNKTLMAQHVSLEQHMLLLTYEAKPRPLSLASMGYTSSDFIAYIYQDVAARFIRHKEMKSLEFTKEKAALIKAWLLEKVPAKRGSPQRQIRRHLMTMFDRNNAQIIALFNNRGCTNDMQNLMRKLLERDDDKGYTYGEVRDFRDVRADLKLLAKQVTYSYYTNSGDSLKAEEFLRIRCPSLVNSFVAEDINKPRERKTKKERVTKALSF